MNTHQVYWKRSGYVEIEGRDGKMYRYGGSHDGLDFRFDGTKIGNIVTDVFTVGILGLSHETINLLTVWNPAESMTRLRKIRVYAGYDFQNLANPIFEGVIFEAMPTNPPEMWLNFKCIFYPIKSDVKEESFSGTKIDLISKIAGYMDLECKWEAKSSSGNDKVKFDINNNPANLITSFCNVYSVACYSDGKILHIVDQNVLDEPKAADIVGVESGLIGLGSVTIKGAVIKRRLNDYNSLHSWVKLESKIVPKANGYYKVITKHHVGHFRGEDWYTELDTLRYNKK